MTIYPAQLTLSRHRIAELAKQIPAVVWSRRCFGVVLHAEGSVFAVPQSGNRIIVEIPVSDFEILWE